MRENVIPLLHRVIATLAKRVTAKNTAQGEKTTSEGTVLFNGLDSILRTAGDKTTGGRKQRGENNLIKPDYPQKDLLQLLLRLSLREEAFTALVTAVKTSWGFLNMHSLRTAKTMSLEGDKKSRFTRKNSRITLFMRLRNTAFFTP